MRHLFTVPFVVLALSACSKGGGVASAESAAAKPSTPAAGAAAGGAKAADTTTTAGAEASATPPGQAPGTTGATMEAKAGAGEMFATFQTSMGDIKVRLFPKDAPKTVENFVTLAEGTKEWTDPKSRQKVKKPLYDGTIFHRVIPKFMIQGGDPLGTGTGGPGYRFEDEFQSGRRFDKPGLLAMANAGPHTNGSQFFITEVPTPHLSNRHTIFGEVVEGLDLVKKIARVQTGPMDRPAEPVTLKKVVIERK